METFLEIILLIAAISMLGLILGYLVGTLSCQRANTSHIIQKGKICEEHARLSQDQNDLLEKESKELIEASKKESLEEQNNNSAPLENNLTELKLQINALTKPNNNQADDLKEIKGIGKVIEKKLNDLGVFHFEQIAAWDEKAIALVDEHLAFKGRIKREKWIEQAKELAKQKEA